MPAERRERSHERTESTFRCNRKGHWITYSQCPISKEDILAFFRDIAPLKEYCIAQERHADGNHHLHCWIQYQKAFNIRTEKYFDYEGYHPEIRPGVGRKNRLNYCFKEDEEPLTNIDLQTDKTFVNDDILEYKHSRISLDTLTDRHPQLLMKVSSLKQGKRAIQSMNEPRGEPLQEPLTKWQRYINIMMNSEPDKRTIFWITDFQGKRGKTEFAKHLEHEYQVFVTMDVKKKVDLQHTLKTFVHEIGNPRAIIFDLLRSTDLNNQTLYHEIEMAKNGSFTSTKYEGGYVRYPKCHVIVMSNGLPNGELLSKDRIYQMYLQPYGEFEIYKQITPHVITY